MDRSHRWLASLIGLSFGALLSVTCAPPPPPGTDCRFNPHCGSGAIGAYCEHDGQCASGYCCESDHCDGGMCTQRCDADPECPPGMLCEHGTCFFACDHHDDCAPGQKCEHGHRVCEW
ncbi:MAG TPA: hypothetical protein VIK91_22605 [Nannocystis sp.]